MKPFYKKRAQHGPEKTIQTDIIKLLREKGWFVKSTHGNMYQSGFPDLFACHSSHGQRWIEVKLPNMTGSRFTAAQLEDFPKLCANGSGVWVMTGATKSEYDKLFNSYNWWTYTDSFKEMYK